MFLNFYLNPSLRNTDLNLYVNLKKYRNDQIKTMHGEYNILKEEKSVYYDNNMKLQ